MMKKMMMMAIGLMLTGSMAMGLPVKLDVGAAADPVEAGWQQLVLTDTFDGITVTISSPVTVQTRYRTDSPYEGIEDEEMWRDFAFVSSGSLIVTIEGLVPSTLYEISLAAFDYGTRNATPRTADWQVDGQTVITASYGIPDVALSTMMPSDEWDYLYEAEILSDAAGQIVLQSAPSAVGTYTPRLNGVIINAVTKAYNPSPADGAIAVPLDATLSWNAGMDPNDPTQTNPKIEMHYLYWAEDEPNFLDVTPEEITAVGATGSYIPQGLDYDKTYYWRVDEGVDVNGTVSAPDSPATITGNVWSFETFKSVPVIDSEPVNVKVQAGQTAEFTVGFVSLSPAVVTWYKDGAPITPDARVTINTTMAETTLSIADTSTGDEAAYTCDIVNAGGSKSIDPVYLSIARLLAQYPFEQNGNDIVGVNHGTAVNGMDYVVGVSTVDGQAWAADPNGTNYFEVPASTAYPRAGFGKGLEEFTYSFWVKRGEFIGNGRILGTFNDDSNSAVQVLVTGGGSLGCYIRQEGNQFRQLNTPDGVIDADQWHHVLFTFKDNFMRCFVDGVYEYFVDYTEFEPMVNFADWQYPLTLLARQNRAVVDEFYPGQVDDLRIYNYEMEREAIGKLYYDVTNEPSCVYGSPDLDLSGPEGEPDCVVDLYDFAVFAADWLNSGLYDPQP